MIFVAFSKPFGFVDRSVLRIFETDNFKWFLCDSARFKKEKYSAQKSGFCINRGRLANFSLNRMVLGAKKNPGNISELTFKSGHFAWYLRQSPSEDSEVILNPILESGLVSEFAHRFVMFLKSNFDFKPYMVINGFVYN